MDQPPEFGAGEDMNDNSLFVATAAPHASKETKSPSTKPRWLKHFQKCRNAGESSSAPKSYMVKSRADHVFPPLIAVDSTAGTGECKIQTEKQWDTIIKNAKLNDKVSDDMKAAKFFHFGHVVRNPKPAKPSLAFNFECRLSQAEAEKEIEGLPLPLGNYDAKRRLNILLRRRFRPAIVESEDSSFPSSFSSSSGTPISEHEDILTGTFQTPAHIHTQRAATQPKMAKLGLDLSYPKYAAEEYFNDYELVKGVGRVPVNQKAPEPIVPVDEPWNLSPGAYALKDLRYPLQKMITSDLTINNLMIFPSINFPSLDDDDESLQLRWNGITEQTVTVFKERDIKSFAFKDVTSIKYNKEEQKLFFEFSSADTYKLEELLLILLPVAAKDWMTLQSCCYSLANGQKHKQHCDSADAQFYEDKAKSLMSLRIKRPPIIPFPNRHIPHAASRGQNVIYRSRKPSRSLSQTCLNTPTGTPAESSNATPGRNSPAVNESPEAVISRDKTPNNAVATNNPELYDNEEAGTSAPGRMISTLVALQRTSQNSDDTELGPELFEDFPTTENAKIVEDWENRTDDLNIEGLDHARPVEPEVDNQSVAGLYYKSTLRLRAPIPVRLNDLVVRLRSETEREKGGRRDRLDIFDGPWRIVELGKNKCSLNLLSHQDDRDGNESPSTLQYNRTKEKKMLKTKVRLGFPRDTQANCWVELNVLHPVVKMEKVRDGKLHASCWPVTELAAFKKLHSEMESRKLEAFNPKYLSLTMKKLEENSDVTREQTSEAEDSMNGEADKDESEMEEDLAMHVVEIKTGIFVAIMEADPKAVDDGDSYLVEKLRAKRLRLFKLNSPQVRKQNLTTDHEDPWVKRLLKEDPHIAFNRIVVSEYKVHWAGWADEDDTWDLGTGNIAKGFVDEFHLLTDAMRNVSFEARMADPKEMIFKDDLPKASKIRASVGSNRSVKSAISSMVKNHGVSRDEEYQDSEMLDADEDIATSKAIQASLDEVKAARTQMDLEALQREMGVAPQEMEANSNSHNEADRSEIDSIMHHESENDGLDDDFMADENKPEEAEYYSEEGGHYGGDEE